MDEKIYTRKRLRIPKIMYQRNEGKIPNRKNKKVVTIISILAIAITVAYFSLKAIEPIMEQQCKNMAKSIATKVSNEEATKAMANYEYDDLLNITKDEQGNIKFIGTNIVTVNKIISDIPVNIQKELEKSSNNNFSIRLGSFLGSNLFAGRGPNVNIKMEIVGNLETDLRSEFKTAGINQTLHRIYLEIKCNVIILTPFETIEEQIVNQALLAEGVIVGEVPNSYYNLEGISHDNAIDIIE